MVEAKKEVVADPAAPEKSDATKEEKKIGKFTHGDHMIHLLFQKGKKFVPLTKDETTVDIIIEVEIGDQKQYTSGKDGVVADSDSAVIWNEHMFFEMKNLEPRKARDLTVIIRVLNQGWLRNEVIGMAQYDLSSIYFNDKNKIEHRWIALENTDSEDSENIKGLLKISANCTGPNDNAQKLEPDSGPEPANLQMFMSSNLKRTFHQLRISILEAHDLPDFGGFLQTASLECYFKVHYGGGNSLKTDVQNQVDKKVPINQTFLLPVQTPILADRLLLDVFDYNTLQTHTKIGSLILSAKQLLADGEKPGGFYIWRNLYGSPKENSGKEADEMNKNPEVASDYKGIVLLHIEAEENEKPKKSVETMTPEIKKAAVEKGFYEKEEHELLIEIGQGVTLPCADKDYKVQVSIMNNDWKTGVPKEKKGNYLRWSDRSEVLQWKLHKNPYSQLSAKEENKTNVKDEYRIYIYLLDEDDKPICFWHGAVNEFKERDAKWRWIQLKPDRTYGIVEKDHEAGMLSVKISINKLKPSEGTTDFKKEHAWKNKPPRRVGAYNLRCFIFQCRDLPAADSDGSSDPFIQIFNTSGENVTTSVIEDNINPIFMEAKEVALDFLDFDTFSDAPPCIFDVMDSDQGFISNSADFLGRCTIFIKDMGETLTQEDEIRTPAWFPIKFGTDPNSPNCGEILCSFALVPGDMILSPVQGCTEKMNRMVHKLNYEVDINCLGLRQLESIGLMPIQKAFVCFMVKSLTDPRTSGSMTNVKTHPGPTGSNPNINSLVKFNVPLPTENLYCPSLSCTVYDQVFLGLSQPVVGTFTIPLGQIMQDIKKNNNEFLQKAKVMLEALKNAKNSTEQNNLSQISANQIKVEVSRLNMSTSKMIEDVKEIDCDESQPILSKKASATVPNQKGGVQKKKTMLEKKEINDIKAALAKAVKEDFERKKNEKEKRKIEAREQDDETSHNVVEPKYEFDFQLKVYREISPPAKELYKPVGFNDQELIKEIMQLDTQINALAANIAPEAAKTPKILRAVLAYQASKLGQQIIKSSRSQKDEIVGKTVQLVSVEQESTAIDQEMLNQLIDLKYAKANKHYRKFFEDELENDESIFDKKKPVFFNYDIQRGQSRGVEKSFFSFGGGEEDESGEASTIRKVGKFKGTIEILNREKQADYDKKKKEVLEHIFQNLTELYKQKTGNHEQLSVSCLETPENYSVLKKNIGLIGIKLPGLNTFLEEIAYSSMVKLALTRKTDAIVHLYLIQGFEFASRDIGSPSDPFLIIRCGDIEDNDEANYQNDEPNPKFMRRLDFNVSFPGAPPLEIFAYDYDMLFGNDLIGKTTIDLDDRFFNPKWQAIEEKPIETRELYHQSSKLNQGVIEIFVDIDSTSKSSDVGKVWDIGHEPVNDFEVRVAVFRCKGVPMMDGEGTSDVYIKAFISDTDKQETDTHYRNTTGIPSFNYRLLFGVKTPSIKPFVITLQAWDRDLLKSNDLICQWELDITEIVQDSQITMQPITLQKKYYQESLKSRLVSEGNPEPLKFCESEKDSYGSPDTTIILTTYAPTDKDKKEPITILLDLRVVPIAYSAMNKVGSAREEPNVEPHLPPPEGRFKLSLNPIAMLNQMCGAALRRKIWCCICCVLCLIVVYYVFPLIASFVTIFSGGPAGGPAR